MCSNFKELKINMNIYVLYSYFYDKYVDDVDVFIVYIWMDLLDKVNINVKNKFINFCTRKIKQHYRIFLFLNKRFLMWKMNNSL
jgi:hypothetical protein